MTTGKRQFYGPLEAKDLTCYGGVSALADSLSLKTGLIKPLVKGDPSRFEYFVCVYKENVVGWLVRSKDYYGFPMIFVTTLYREQGIGKKLVELYRTKYLKKNDHGRGWDRRSKSFWSKVDGKYLDNDNQSIIQVDKFAKSY